MKKLLGGLYLTLILLFLYLPIGTLMVLSFNEGKSMNAWQGFSTKWYAEMFRNQEIKMCIRDRVYHGNDDRRRIYRELKKVKYKSIHVR